ncbi:hypothetical protein QJS10_CPB14g00133 [Acorus calamus]|uniref:Protease Do-like 1, chloroplastic n=1 Tax=Acorus calamus TaxID=4465 RepID=A0AAV9DDA0_ACOCL|nr:hypothetical protein QJS10_CPB14g00133 [Acorus calamus]
MAAATAVSLFRYSPPHLTRSSTPNNRPLKLIFPKSLLKNHHHHHQQQQPPKPPSPLDSFFVFCTSLALSLSIYVADADAFVVSPPPRKLQTDELATVRLFQENTPSVVYITNLAAGRVHVGRAGGPAGVGSGFVWDKNGHIVTNYHVIRGASDLRVTLADQSTYEARVVGFDQDKDVAVLRVEAPKDKLRPIPVGVSADLLVGQKVFAIGNPLGLGNARRFLTCKPNRWMVGTMLVLALK